MGNGEDAHYHRNGYPAFLSVGGREVRFCGVHPWEADALDAAARAERLAALEATLAAEASVGVGEIGLDRLRARTISAAQREVFAAQLERAAAFGRPVVLHGAKCWGEVVAACKPYAGRIPAFLFHGFSRSAGLLPDIFALNGFVSVGPAVLNDHAVNYRDLVKALPAERLLAETDADRAAASDGADIAAVVDALAAVRGLADRGAFAAVLSANAARFAGSLL